MNLSKAIKILTFLVVSRYLLPVLTSTMTVTTLINLITTIVSFIVILIARKRFQAAEIDKKKLVNVFLLCSAAVMIYSCLVARSYEQWRYATTVFFPTLILPFFTIAAGDKDSVRAAMRVLIYSALPLSALLYPSGIGGMWDFSHFVSFLFLFLLALPYVSFKWKVLFIVLGIVSIISNLDNRSNMLNSGIVALVLFVIYIPPKALVKRMSRALRVFFMFMPPLLLVLGVLGIFNIFTFGDAYSEEIVVNHADSESSLTKDTRTGIFKDALTAIDDNNAYLWGISAAGLYRTELEDVSDEFFEELKMGRMGNEVGILEYLLRGGLIFVVITFLLYYHASKIALRRSNNLFCKSLGLFIAFRWAFLFIESQPALNLANLMDFLIIGICLSPAFRRMNDAEIRIFMRQTLKWRQRKPKMVQKRRIVLSH